MKTLSLQDLSQINGGCQTCYNTAKKAGRYIRNGVFISDMKDAWDSIWD